ncbi:MAG: hypothetical protein NVSMB42_05100 [Herpetosiphon sp.]
MIDDLDIIVSQIKTIHAAIRQVVVQACEAMSSELLGAVVGDEGGDTVFALDRVSEATLLEQFGRLAASYPLVLVAEGLGQHGIVTLPEGTLPENAAIRIIVDPIDGTRGLMYQKRPGWILTGIAPNHGAATSLADIEAAVQTEIPLVKQHLSDTWWAIDGRGVWGERWDRLSNTGRSLHPQPSRSGTIAQGFGNVTRFFPGAREELAAIDDQVAEIILGPIVAGRAQAFEDQYICSGGQLAELINGHDRWLADLRPLVEQVLNRRGLALGICCHPYDLCTELIAREAGVVIVAPNGSRLDAPLDINTDVAWMGFANQRLYALVAPVLQQVLRQRRLLL